jgi:four helix bundle protein
MALLRACRMKELSAKRQRTLALHHRALQFSVDVNACCPNHFSNVPSRVVWDQLVRAADSASNNLIEADDASSDADFLSKMGTALREAKESRAALMKVRMGQLDHFEQTARKELESEETQLSAIFATIILNMRRRLDDEKRDKDRRKRTRRR